ncbi:DUF4227 family protein [Paenibacillus sp. 1A_MP2]|uniref:DUF4227 family protein n=1 Tax=Paenibacillus sp. 1A_MP2 TaxID=3457495 RepID=UPI003FCD894E
MIISLRRGLRFIRFIVFFAALVYLFYHVLDLFNGWISPVDQYQMPTGNAVKVFQETVWPSNGKDVLRWQSVSVYSIGTESSWTARDANTEAGCPCGSPVR